MAPLRALFASIALISTATGLTFRPPSIPLITTSPFEYMASRRHFNKHKCHSWDGNKKETIGLLRVDGATYSFLGSNPHAGTNQAKQLEVRVFPTRTVFYLSIADKVFLNVTFLSTMFSDDYVRLSRPASYISLTAASADGAAHNVEAFFALSCEHAVNNPAAQNVTWSSSGRSMKIGNSVQNILGSKGDRVNIDWGFLHLLGDGWAGSLSKAISAFKSNGALPVSPDTRTGRSCADDMPG